MNLAESLIRLYEGLDLFTALPPGFSVMNPYTREGPALDCTRSFYRKFFSDPGARRVVLGINPGRHGAGSTGIPFTDPKRLHEYCGLDFDGPSSHEPSSVFVYRMIVAMGGPEEFYRRFLLFPASPLGFLRTKAGGGGGVNANYYDDPALCAAVEPFIVENMDRLCAMGIDRSRAWCLGLGPHFRVMKRLNTAHGWFSQLDALPHPRWVIQYKSKEMDHWIKVYREALTSP